MKNVQTQPFWLGQINQAAIYVESPSGSVATTPVTGLTAGSFVFNYAREADTNMSQWTPAGGQFQEKGLGFYEVRLPASLFTAVGEFDFVPVPNNGLYVASATRGVIQAAQHEFRCIAVPKYDPTGGTLMYLVHLEQDGQNVAAVTSCTVAAYLSGGGSAVYSQSSSSPNAQGVFTLGAASFSPTPPAVYEVYVTIVYNGVTYTGVCYQQQF